MVDLFGHEIVERPKPHRQTLKEKTLNNYRPSSYEFARCKNCRESMRLGYHGKYYWKCKRLGTAHSEATDIKANHVCDDFIPRTEGESDTGEGEEIDHE